MWSVMCVKYNLAPYKLSDNIGKPFNFSNLCGNSVCKLCSKTKIENKKICDICNMKLKYPKVICYFYLILE